MIKRYSFLCLISFLSSSYAIFEIPEMIKEKVVDEVKNIHNIVHGLMQYENNSRDEKLVALFLCDAAHTQTPYTSSLIEELQKTFENVVYKKKSFSSESLSVFKQYKDYHVESGAYVIDQNMSLQNQQKIYVTLKDAITTSLQKSKQENDKTSYFFNPFGRKRDPQLLNECIQKIEKEIDEQLVTLFSTLENNVKDAGNNNQAEGIACQKDAEFKKIDFCRRVWIDQLHLVSVCNDHMPMIMKGILSNLSFSSTSSATGVVSADQPHKGQSTISFEEQSINDALVAIVDKTIAYALQEQTNKIFSNLLYLYKKLKYYPLTKEQSSCCDKGKIFTCTPRYLPVPSAEKKKFFGKRFMDLWETLIIDCQKRAPELTPERILRGVKYHDFLYCFFKKNTNIYDAFVKEYIIKTYDNAICRKYQKYMQDLKYIFRTEKWTDKELKDIVVFFRKTSMPNLSIEFSNKDQPLMIEWYKQSEQ